MKYRCLLFDLDGTLVDSRADLTTGINLMLGDLGRGPLPADHVLRFVGEGVRLLVERALRATQPGEPGGAEVEGAIERFRGHYRAHLCDRTRPYPGVEEALAHFAALPKAVVTNKPSDLSLALLEGLGLRAHFAAVIGGDSLPERKPAPAPLLAAAVRCGSDPAACLMVGDTAVDMLAGRAAGMTTCGFVGGFRGRAELAAAGADVLIEEFAELRRVVEGG